jgi:lipopolysaccharide export system permease protein
MNIIDRYILRAHIGPFLFGFFTVVFIFLMQFVMNYLDQLVGKGLSTWVIIQLMLYNIAWMVILAAPMGVLFSTLMAFGSMSASHETTIIKSSGGSLIRMMIPVIFSGIFITAGLFIFNDRVLPETNHRAKILMNDIRRKKPTFNLESGRFSSEIEGYTIFPRKVDSLSGKLYGVTIYDHTRADIRNIISADTGIVSFSGDYSNLVLDLYHGEIHQVPYRDVNNYRIVRFDTYRILMEASGFNFERTEEDMISRGDREMSIADMEEIVSSSMKNADQKIDKAKIEFLSNIEYLIEGLKTDTTDTQREMPEQNIAGIIKTESDSLPPDTTLTKAEVLSNVKNRINFSKTVVQSDIMQAGQYMARAGQYEVEIYKKYAIPFACLLFIFVGCPLGVLTRRGNFGISAGISLLFYLFYWICLIGGEKLADRGMLHPMLSMWLGNIILFVTGVVLTLRVSYESISFVSFKLPFRLFKKN